MTKHRLIELDHIILYTVILSPVASPKMAFVCRDEARVINFHKVTHEKKEGRYIAKDRAAFSRQAISDKCGEASVIYGQIFMFVSHWIYEYVT